MIAVTPVDTGAGTAPLGRAPLEPAPLGAGRAVVAFDVGGTDTKSALVTADGRLVGLTRTPTPVGGPDPAATMVAHLAGLARQLRDAHPDERVEAAGVSVPGLVDETHGIGIFSSNLGWRDAPIRDLAESALQLPVAFGHDVRAAGDAEHRLGAARGYDDAIVLAIGTGIAGAIVLGGRPHVGDGYAGEFGHSLADPHGDPCPCGARGCLETIASASAIARRYTAQTGNPAPGARAVLEARERGDVVAAAVWDAAIDALAEQIARVTAVLGPQVVVIGGGLAQAGPALFDPLRERLDALLSFHRRPALIGADLGADAGLLGTALAARDLAERLAPAVAS